MGTSFFIGFLIVVPVLLFFMYLLIRLRYKKARSKASALSAVAAPSCGRRGSSTRSYRSA